MKKPGVFHEFIGTKIVAKNHALKNKIIKRAEIKRIFNAYNIPNVLHQRFLKEMELSGILRIKDKQNIELLIKENDQSK